MKYGDIYKPTVRITDNNSGTDTAYSSTDESLDSVGSIDPGTDGGDEDEWPPEDALPGLDSQ